MTEEDIAVKLEGHEHEIGSLKHRVGDLEKESHTISELVLITASFTFLPVFRGI